MPQPAKPGRKKLNPHRTTKSDWLNQAVRVLVRDGIDRVKVQIVAKQLRVSRSSFYWFFRNARDLHEQILDQWRANNTTPIVEHAERYAPSITEAILNIFECWLDKQLYDPEFDMAVRLWARRDRKVLEIVSKADRQRMDALTQMFQRYGYNSEDALVRARVIYLTQIGHYTLDIHEDLPTRLSRTRAYLIAFSGVEPDQKIVKQFVSNARLAANGVA